MGTLLYDINNVRKKLGDAALGISHIHIKRSFFVPTIPVSWNYLYNVLKCVSLKLISRGSLNGQASNKFYRKS